MPSNVFLHDSGAFLATFFGYLSHDDRAAMVDGWALQMKIVSHVAKAENGYKMFAVFEAKRRFHVKAQGGVL